MTGIFSDLIAPATTKSRRLTAQLLWDTDLKRNYSNYYSKPLRSQIVDLDDDFEADFQGFKDFPEDEAVEDVKPFAFTTASNQSSLPRGSKPPLCYSGAPPSSLKVYIQFQELYWVQLCASVRKCRLLLPLKLNEQVILQTKHTSHEIKSQVLGKIDALRKKVVSVGKEYASHCAKINVAQDLRGILIRIGRFKSLELHYTKVHLKPIRKLWENFDQRHQTK